MSKGSLPRPVAVPPLSYAPDGLTEADIDALMVEVFGEDAPKRRRPGWLSTDQIETRRARHRDRQAVRSLLGGIVANFLVDGMPGQGKTAAARQIAADPTTTGPDWDEVA